MRVTSRVALSLLACCLVFPLPALAEDGPPLEPEVPQVLTPARLKQAQVDAGASVTVIDRDMIAALGARDIPEILRLVPGMMVTNESVSGHTWGVNYHGTNLTDIRRMQVLVDGMSIIQPGLARILWSDIPVAMDDIERIEVIRGPDAAAYGANSFTGVINIITTHPEDSTENLVRLTGGDRQVADGIVRLVQHGENSDGRVTLSAKSDAGFDHARKYLPVHDDRRVATLNTRHEYRPTDHDRLEFQTGFSDSDREAEADDYGLLTRYEQDPVVHTKNLNMLGRWSRELSPDHVIQVQAYTQYTDSKKPFRACLNPAYLSGELAALAASNLDAVEPLAESIEDWLDTGPAMAPDAPTSPIVIFISTLPAADQPLAMAAVTRVLTFGAARFTETCGDVDLDIRESRVDIEVQDTLRVNENLRVVSGASYRRDSGASEAYLLHQRDSALGRLFAHGEYRVTPDLLLNVGTMLEDDGISGTTLSPRAALNLRLRDQQSLRVVSSRATRTQDLYEEYASTRVIFRDLAPPYNDGGGNQSQRELFLIQTAPGNLKPERINAMELGYFGYFAGPRLELDVRVFHERLNKLISDAINPFNFNANNNSWSEILGFEWQVKHTFRPGSWLWASYAYLDNDSTHKIERKFTARHSGSLAVAHRFTQRFSGSAAWYFSRDQNPTPINEDDFDRLDLRLACDVPVDVDRVLTFSANAQGRFSNDPHIHGDNYYQNRINGYLGMQMTF